MNRRNFIKTGLAGAGALASYNFVSAQSGSITPMPMGFLGSTNEIVSEMGIDCFPFAYESVSVPTINKILNRATQLGINYIDVSPDYNDAESKLGEIVPYMREKFFISTKVTEITLEGAQRQIEQSLQFMKVEKLDLVCIKDFGDVSKIKDINFLYSSKGAMQALRNAKQSGLIKYIGVEGNTNPGRFHTAMDRGEIDVLINPANFAIKHTYNFEDKVWSRARAKKLGIIARDVLGPYDSNGVHRMPADKYDRAVRYAKSIEGVGSALVGVKNVTALDKAARAFTTLHKYTQNEKLSLVASGVQLARIKSWGIGYGLPID